MISNPKIHYPSRPHLFQPDCWLTLNDGTDLLWVACPHCGEANWSEADEAADEGIIIYCNGCNAAIWMVSFMYQTMATVYAVGLEAEEVRYERRAA